MRPVAVDVLAVTPQGWQLCPPCSLMMGEAGMPGTTEILPPSWQQDLDRLAAALAALTAAHGDGVRLRLVDPRSPEGVARSLRFGIRRYPAFVVAGRQRVQGLDPGALERAVSSAQAAAGGSASATAGAGAHLRSLWRALRDIIYGATIYDMVRDLHKQRGQLERLFLVCVFGDLVGIPLLPPYYTLRLLPYALPHLGGWRRSLLRERDLTELCDQEIT